MAHKELCDFLLAVIANKGKILENYICTTCGYVYEPAFGDPVGGIPPGTAFEDLPEDWTCPVCYVSKDRFDPL
jgi:rubredoxin